MTQIATQNKLGPEGTITFKLTPIENGKDKLFLIDIGSSQDRNRITLSVIKSGEERDLLLETYSGRGGKREKQQRFEFRIGASFDVELVWSTEHHKIAVFVNNNEIMDIQDEAIGFEDLGEKVHFGEDISGENQTQIVAVER